MLLSKADLLVPDDRERMLRYVSDRIRFELGLSLPVHPVSIKAGHSGLLDEWFQREILPPCDRHTELSRRSVRRQICTLRAAVEAVRMARLQHAARTAGTAGSSLRQLDRELRKVAGRFSDARAEGLRITDEVRETAGPALREAARTLVEVWQRAAGGAPAADVVRGLEQVAAEQAASITAILRQLAEDSARVIRLTAEWLNLHPNAPDENELLGALTEMPRLDAGAIAVRVQPRRLILKLSGGWAKRRTDKQLQEQTGEQVFAAFAAYGKILGAWVRRKFAELQSRFDSYADGYPAQFDRLANQQAGSPEEEAAMRRDLEALETSGTEGEKTTSTPAISASQTAPIGLSALTAGQCACGATAAPH